MFVRTYVRAWCKRASGTKPIGSMVGWLGKSYLLSGLFFSSPNWSKVSSPIDINYIYYKYKFSRFLEVLRLHEHSKIYIQGACMR